MTIPLLVVAGVVALVLVGLYYRRSFAGFPGDGPEPDPGWHRCGACRGAGATPDPTTKTGYGMCATCNGTGWARG